MLKEMDFKSADMKKIDFKNEYKPLITKLVMLQQKARSMNIGLVVLFEGFAASGRGSRISDLMYNLDARSTTVHSLTEYAPEQIIDFALSGCDTMGPKPFLAEFWESLNERGCTTFYNRGWYTRCLEAAIYDLYSGENAQKNVLYDVDSLQGAIKPLLESAKGFEKNLSDDGYIVVKFFTNIRRKTQSERVTGLVRNPSTRWRVSPEALSEMGHFEGMRNYYDATIAATDTDYAPWIVLNGEHTRESNLIIAKTLVEKLSQAIAAKEAQQVSSEAVAQAAEHQGKDAKKSAPKAPKKSAFPIQKNYPTLEKVNYDLALSREEYKVELKKLQKKLYDVQQRAFLRHIPIVIMYEGWDAAGKGGNIKRVAQALDARSYTIFPSPAPTKTELAHPFLWRYWTRLPLSGRVGIYDRSWYGRVLVERVEGFAKPNEWQRAYDEINRFEKDLVDWGAVVVKFWVEIDQDEQLNRFNLRAENPDKAWKLTDEDWRNREKYDVYREAVEDMFRLTSTEIAPWTLLESNDKLYARIKALRTIIAAVEARLEK